MFFIHIKSITDTWEQDLDFSISLFTLIIKVSIFKFVRTMFWSVLQFSNHGNFLSPLYLSNLNVPVIMLYIKCAMAFFLNMLERSKYATKMVHNCTCWFLLSFSTEINMEWDYHFISPHSHILMIINKRYSRTNIFPTFLW